MQNDPEVRKYTSAGGVDVYKLPVEAFPTHFTNCYLVMTDPVTLIDAASGQDSSNASLLDCFARVRAQFNQRVTLSDVKRLILTHGHIDHFGGLHFVVEQSGAAIGIHELDMSIVRHFKERLVVSTKNLQIFLERAGLGQERIAKLIEMYRWSKDLFRARPVDFVFDEGPLPNSPFVLYHTPGHCPGQVCIQLDDILFTADHVLSRITPNQSPEFIVRYTGLGHYIASLKKVKTIPGINIGLGGHELEMKNVYERVDASIAFHEGRLDKTLNLCVEPRTVAEVSRDLFGERKGYHVLLAFLETGAHMEYLHERGMLAVVNLDEVDEEQNPVLRYQKQ